VRRWLYGWETPFALGVVLLALTGLLTSAELGLPFRFESLTLDLRFRLRPERPTPARVVIVGIDDASIAEIGRWPWSRVVFARLLNRLTAAGAKVVGFDLLFSEPQPSPITTERSAIESAMAPLLQKLAPVERSQFEVSLSDLAHTSDPDATLAEAISMVGTVILPFAVELRLSGMTPNVRPPLPLVLEKAEYDRVRGVGPDHLPEAVGLRMPIAQLADAGTLAHVTTVPDAGGGYHYDYPILRYDNSYLPSLSLEAVRSFLGIARTNVVVDLGRGIDVGSLHVPTDEGMRLLVNYYPPGTFQYISFVDALLDRVPRETFAGKIVLVGATAAGLGDVFATPYAPARPGIERHATLIANMLNADFLRRDDHALALDALLILLGGLGIGILSRLGAIAASVATAMMFGSLAALDYAAFARLGLWLNFTFPAVTILLTFSLILGGKYTVEWWRGRWIRQAFSRYLHPDLVDELCRSHAMLRLGGEERELTVLFVDVRDFSTIAEGLSASQLVTVMNEFFTAMTDVVLAHRGMLDKYIGDSLMAVFGAPLPDPDHAMQACRASIDMRAALASLQTRWRAERRPCLEMRIGINTGRMVIGNMGTDRRFDYTVMGDEVNIASRLEGANKALGTDILISAATAKAADGHIIVAPRGTIKVKGRKQPVEVFEILEGYQPMGASGHERRA